VRKILFSISTNMKFCPLCKRNWEDEFRVCPIDGLALQSAPAEGDPRLGLIVGQARVAEKLADGDSGPIYRADDPVRGPIAVQFIASDRLSSPVLAEAFENTLKLAAKVNHTNVVAIYSLEHTPDGQSAVLMEYVKGATLEDFRKSSPPMEVEQACRIAREIGEGVLAAHRISMMHGSLQPSHILIAADGKVKVAGFHRSGLRDDISPLSLVAAGIIYLAPERAGIIQDVAVPDYRADVYSLGVILYELLTGKLPYEANGMQELGAVMDAGPPLPPSFTNPRVSPTLSRVVLKAISKYPGDRHRSMEEFLRELEAACRPVRQPEKADADAGYAPPRRAPVDNFDDPRDLSRPEGGNWPERKQADEGSFFSWFKTRSGGKGRVPEPESSRTGADDSVYDRKPRFRGRDEDDIVERTVLATGRKGRSRQRSTFFDTFTRYRRDPDLSQTDALPRRRFSSKVYIWMGVAALVLVAAIALVTYFFFVQGADTGTLKVESTPPGAQVFLNNEQIGATPLPRTDVKVGTYTLRLQLEGYEIFATDLEVTSKSNIQITQPLMQVTQLPIDKMSDPSLPPPQPPPTPPEKPRVDDRQPFESLLNKAIARSLFFPPESGNAWDILQDWRKKEGAESATWEQSRQNLCRVLERVGGEKLDRQDAKSVRSLLEKVQKYMPDQACTSKLQIRYELLISNYKSRLRAAMDRQNYVTPDSDNALKYIQWLLSINSEDLETQTLKSDIYKLAIDQAQAKSNERQHQEALAIYAQLKLNYPDAPGGLDAINKGIERETKKLQLLNTLNQSFSIQVKHGHSFSFVPKLKRECTGVLRVNGFTIEYQSTGSHSFKVTYESLKSVYLSKKDKITIESNTIENGKMELEQIDRNPSPSLEEIYKKILEYRKSRDDYMRP
jgi:serine/threonine protein kinase